MRGQMFLRKSALWSDRAAWGGHLAGVTTVFEEIAAGWVQVIHLIFKYFPLTKYTILLRPPLQCGFLSALMLITGVTITLTHYIRGLGSRVCLHSHYVNSVDLKMKLGQGLIFALS